MNEKLLNGRTMTNKGEQSGEQYQIVSDTSPQTARRLVLTPVIDKYV